MDLSGGRWSAPTNNRGMPPTMDDRDLSRSRMRDPDQDREDNRRVYHKLQPQQMDPSTPRGASPAGNEASPVSDPNVDTFIQAVRDFNMKRTKDAIRLGLEELQGHRKEIRLFGRCGSVLFTPRAPVTDRDWEFNQLEEMMRRTGTRGHFSPITTTNTESINNLTLVTIPSKKAVLERVVTPWKTYTEVTWSAMDRDVDFEVVLQAREGIVHDTKSALGRTDVKPFSNFRKKLSLGPHNSHITCYDIKNFLEVRNIVFKESRFYEKPSDFKIIIHRMKELELERNPVINSVTGYTSSENDDGKVWYEIELYHEKATKMLTANRTLTQGLVAPWEALDLVGANDDSDIVSRMVKALMVIVDEFQKASRLE
ncbi:hypothetical protein BGW38_003209 [Lunasporangiospora selenospora]|uniref:DUF7905 domain-containing protein n=1 Tax=Lunasporangiospora selenospora TaxID=979761 RepID=A0A9P6KIU2_9FUNG|nr:hypothetical protein BGW38_003209 [Lunasporangiospora selenospora]